MEDSQNTQNKTSGEIQKIFSLSVKFFEQGDFNLAKQGFELILKSPKEQKKKRFLSSPFKEPSLHEKAENYLKEIMKRQAEAVQGKEQPEKVKTVRSGPSVSILKKIKRLTRHPLIMGIDISDHSIEILQLNEDKSIKLCSRVILEKGIVESAEIKDKERLKEALCEVFKETKISSLTKKNRARVKGLLSLPEPKAFIREFVFETRDNLHEKIKEKIKETIPVAFDELRWDYLEPTGTQLDKIKVLVVAVPEKTINDYLYFFWDQGIDPVVFDIEASSVARALLPSGEQKGGVAIIDMGAKTTIINIFGPKKDLNLSVSVFYAGNYFTEQISKKIKITEQEAENKKQELGFAKDPVKPVLEECSADLIKEIKDALKYHQNRFGFKTDRIVLTGGSALLPGIKEYFQKNFVETVEIGNPLKNIEPGVFFPDKQKAMLFANVIGLAIRGINKDFIDSGINLLADEIKKQEKTLQRERERFILYLSLYFIVIVLAIIAVIFTLYRLGFIKIAIHE